MNFVTLEFATFFLFVLVAGWLLRERDGEYRAFLLVCNLFFYALAVYSSPARNIILFRNN